MTDADLVRRALAGRSEAYAELAGRWAGRILALCHARVRRADVAEDMAQETLLRGFRSLGSLAAPEKFGAWLCGIAHRACLDWLKSRQRSEIPFSTLDADRNADDLLGCQSWDDELDRKEDNHRLMAEVEALPDELRTVILIYYYNDVTYRDVAEVLGVSTATVNARLTKARLILRERLSETTKSR